MEGGMQIGHHIPLIVIHGQLDRIHSYNSYRNQSVGDEFACSYYEISFSLRSTHRDTSSKYTPTRVRRSATTADRCSTGSSTKVSNATVRE